MKYFKRLLPIEAVILSMVILLVSCNKSKEIPPFPSFENEYDQPITKSFEFSEPDTLEKISMTPIRLNSLPKTKFDLDNILSKPFDLEITSQIKDPIPTKPFVWDSLPSTTFNLDSLPQAKLNIKVMVLGEPKVVKAGYPVRIDGTTRGVMTLDSNFGYSGNGFCQTIDRDGMIWFGTSSGIVKYDSENLEIYDEEQGLYSRNILTLFEDSKGRLWVGDDLGAISIVDFEAELVYGLSSSFNTQQVLGIMEARDGKFWVADGNQGYKIIDLEEKIIRQLKDENGFAITPFQDNDGLIWLSGLGVNIIDLENLKSTKLTDQNGLFNDFVISIIQDRSGKIWINNVEGIAILDSNKSNISYLSDALNLPKDYNLAQLFQDSTGNIWISTNNGTIYSYSESYGSLDKYKLGNDDDQFVFGIMEDKQGQIWTSNFNGGIAKINRMGGRPGNFTTENGLSSNTNWSTLEANDGSIWIGSANNGIDIFDSEKETIKNLTKNEGLISEDNSRIMEDSKGRIWAYSNADGISIINPEKETILRMSRDKYLDGNFIASILEDYKGNFWLGTGGNEVQLIYVDLKNSLLNKYVIDSSKVNNSVDNIIEDDNKQIWIAGRGLGVQKIDPINNLRVKLASTNGLVSDQVYTLIQDSRKNIWAATHKGVQLIDVANYELTTFTTSEGIGANDVYAIIEQGDKILLGTAKGLSTIKYVERENGESTNWEAKTLTKRQGLDFIDFNMNSFSLDKKGRLWAGVDGQILTVIEEIKEDTLTYQPNISGINIFDEEQIFKNVELIKERSATQDTIWKGNEVIYRASDESIKDSTYLNQNNILWETVDGPYDLPVGLTLPYTQNYLSFNFNGNQFRDPDKLVYRYILEGIDKNWSPISEETTSENYRDLAPGNYNFKVASKGFNGIWSKPVELQFTITPPWWQTWWAYTIFVLLFLGLGLVILHYRSEWLKKENRILEERVTDRTAQLKKTIEELENTQSQLIHSEKMASLGELTAGIAHEIQNPMNFINNFSEVSIELINEMCDELEKGDTEEAKSISKDIVANLDKITHHGNRASSIVKGMLEHSRNTSGKKELTDINVLADEYLRLAYHGLRAKNKSFNADFKTELDESLSKIEVIPQDLGRVLLNLINNAFYAVTAAAADKKIENYKPLVVVSTKKFDDQVLISIKDNGGGIPDEIKEKIFQPFFTTKPTGKGTGLGLSLAYDIITQGHGGALELKTKTGKGTEFLIYIPTK